MFAVIETGGKQYKVIEQDIIFVEKLDVAEGDEIVFDSVLALNNNGLKIGTPVVEGAKVTAKVLKNGKSGLSQTNLEDISYSLNIVKIEK